MSGMVRMDNRHMGKIQANITSDMTDIQLESYMNGNDSLTKSNCSTLVSLDLTDVFTRFSIGNKDYWGTISTPWLALYYIHFIIFFTLLLIINCWCGLILWEKRQSVRKHASFAYIVLTYCVWSFTGAVYYVLMTIGVSSLASQQLTIITEIFELLSVASLMNGLLVTAVYQYYQLQFHVYQSIKKYVVCTIPSVLTVFIIIAILLSARGLTLILLLVLILMLILIGLVGTSILVVMYVELWFRTKISQSLHGNSARKVLTRRIIVRALTYVYLSLLTCDLTNSSLKVIIDMDCIENAQGNRYLWLTEKSLLKIFELVLILQCLAVPQQFQKMILKFVKAQPSLKGKSIINPLSKQEDLSQSLRLEEITELRTEAGKITSFNATKTLSSSKVDAQLPLQTPVVLQPPRHVQCVALPSITSSVIENEHLSHACDPPYNPERNMCSEVEEMRDYNTVCHIPECYSFSNSVVIDIPLKPWVERTTLPLPSIHGRYILGISHAYYVCHLYGTYLFGLFHMFHLKSFFGQLFIINVTDILYGCEMRSTNDVYSYTVRQSS